MLLVFCFTEDKKYSIFVNNYTKNFTCCRKKTYRKGSHCQPVAGRRCQSNLGIMCSILGDEHFTMHSFRVGTAVARVIAGDDIATIMEHVGSKSAHIARRYAGGKLSMSSGRSAGSGQNEAALCRLLYWRAQLTRRCGVDSLQGDCSHVNMMRYFPCFLANCLPPSLPRSVCMGEAYLCHLRVRNRYRHTVQQSVWVRHRQRQEASLHPKLPG